MLKSDRKKRVVMKRIDNIFLLAMAFFLELVFYLVDIIM
jgi:hypothetical protein